MSQLTFHGCLDEQAFTALLERCPILISLHAVMDGVFPFKLLDALYRGMAVISGPVRSPSWIGEADGLFIIPEDQFRREPSGAAIALLHQVVSFLQERSPASLAATRRRIDQHCSVTMLSERLHKISCR